MTPLRPDDLFRTNPPERAEKRTNLRLLVCGGRNFWDRGYLFEILNNIHRKRGISCVIHGNAMGADQLAGEWAVTNNVPEARYPAKWDLHGRAAGPIRNQQMLDEAAPDAVVAFPGGVGTRDMMQRSRRRGLPVWDTSVGHAR